MKRMLTVALVAGLVVLAGAVIVSAVFEGEEAGRPGAAPPPEKRESEASIEGWKALATRLGREGVFGVLYFTDEDCRLRALRLPRLEPAVAPAWTRCEFALSLANQVAPGAAVWHPQGPLWARERGRRIAAFAPGGTPQFDIRGSVPAFKPDGSLTFIDDRGVIALRTDCPTRTARCWEKLISQEELTKQLGEGSLVREMAWLDNDSFAAIVGHERFQNELIAVFDEDRVVNDFLEWTHPRLWDLRVAPGGEYFSVMTERFGPWIFGEAGTFLTDGAVVGGGGVRGRAVAWSPSARWVAIATTASVYIVQSAQLRNQPTIIRLPLSARDVAWR
jgi:hypothetical protein